MVTVKPNILYACGTELPPSCGSFYHQVGEFTKPKSCVPGSGPGLDTGMGLTSGFQ